MWAGGQAAGSIGQGSIPAGSQGQGSFPGCRAGRYSRQDADNLEEWTGGQVLEGERGMG